MSTCETVCEQSMSGASEPQREMNNSRRKRQRREAWTLRNLLGWVSDLQKSFTAPETCPVVIHPMQVEGGAALFMQMVTQECTRPLIFQIMGSSPTNLSGPNNDHVQLCLDSKSNTQSAHLLAQVDEQLHNWFLNVCQNSDTMFEPVRTLLQQIQGNDKTVINIQWQSCVRMQDHQATVVIPMARSGKSQQPFVTLIEKSRQGGGRGSTMQWEFLHRKENVISDAIVQLDGIWVKPDSSGGIHASLWLSVSVIRAEVLSADDYADFDEQEEYNDEDHLSTAAPQPPINEASIQSQMSHNPEGLCVSAASAVQRAQDVPVFNSPNVAETQVSQAPQEIVQETCINEAPEQIAKQTNTQKSEPPHPLPTFGLPPSRDDIQPAPVVRGSQKPVTNASNYTFLNFLGLK